jgi:hypothetical protein
VDNGHAWASKEMTGGAEGRKRFGAPKPGEIDGVYRAWRIEPHFTQVAHGQAKPIERAFRDLCDRIAKHPLCEGAYTGHRTDAKPENYESHAVPLDRFMDLVRTEIDAHNKRGGRRSRQAAGRSLEETFLGSYNDAANVIRRATEEQIRWLMLPRKELKVRRDEAVVLLHGNRFYAPALHELQGQSVWVVYDPAKIQQGVWILKSGHVEPTCFAQCIAAVGFSDTDAARRDMRARRAAVRAKKDQAAAYGTTPAHKLGEMMRGTDAPKRERKKVVEGNFGRWTPKSEAAAAADRDERERRETELFDRVAERSKARLTQMFGRRLASS